MVYLLIEYAFGRNRPRLLNDRAYLQPFENPVVSLLGRELRDLGRDSLGAKQPMWLDLIAADLAQADKPTGLILQPSQSGRRAGRYFNHLPLENRVRLRGIQGNNRKIRQPRVNRQQISIQRLPLRGSIGRRFAGCSISLQLLQRHGLSKAKSRTLLTSQQRDMGATTERFTDILHQGADIGSLAAVHSQLQIIRPPGQQRSAEHTSELQS